MSKVVYLLGAGASFGKRVVQANSIEQGNTTPEDCIIEGLPIVAEIPSRIGMIIERIEEIDITKDYSFVTCEEEQMETELIRKQLVKDLNWLKEESSKYVTIDAFAKFLYLKDDGYHFFKLEMLLAIYFIIEQVLHRHDSRYDTFLTTILNRNLQFPNNIAILSWNYDSQFEFAYKMYQDKPYWEILRYLNSYDVKRDSGNVFAPEKPQIIKINGTASFSLCKRIDITHYNKLDERLLLDILDGYYTYLTHQHFAYLTICTDIAFAWEHNHYMGEEKWRHATNMVFDAEVLVVIGYSFPFFNREIDRRIFGYMPNLKHLYIQDPRAEDILENVKLMFPWNNSMEKMTVVTDVTHFFIPPEL